MKLGQNLRGVRDRMLRLLSRRSDWVWRLLLDVALPAALLYGLGMGCYLLFTQVLSQSAPSGTTDQFKDVFQTVLAISAIAITAFGAGVYRLLSLAIEGKVTRSTDQRLRIANIMHKVDSGLLYWRLFTHSADRPTSERLEYLDEAIDETRLAYEQEATRLDENDPEVERRVLNIRNNWAWYLYEKDVKLGGITPSERETALLCLDYIEKRKAKYSDYITECLDTINEAGGHFR